MRLLHVTLQLARHVASVAIVLAVAAGVLVTMTLMRGGHSGAAGALGAQATPSNGGAGVSVRAGAEVGSYPIPGEAFDLAYDERRDVIWFAVLQITGPDQLVRFDPRTHTMESWDLPDTDYNGLLTRVKVAPDGAIWVPEPYRLVRFDPETQAMTSVDLSEEVNDALPGALDPNTPVPGTWVSAIAFTDQAVLVARANVPYLSIVDANLTVTGRLPMPRAYSGASDMAVEADGTIVALSAIGQLRSVAVLSSSGVLQRTADIDAARLETRQGSVLVSTSGGGAWVAADGAVQPIRAPSSQSPESRAVPDPRGGVTEYDAAGNTIQSVVGGTMVAQMTLSQTTLSIARPGASAPVVVHVQPRVNALVTDSSGNTWYVDGNAQSLVQVRL